MISTIHRVSPAQAALGICAICEERVHLCFRDKAGGKMLGQCCVIAVLTAGLVLSKAGLRDPHPLEFLGNTDH